MITMSKDFLNEKFDEMAYTLDFPYELKKRYKKMHKEDDDYSELIYELLYKEGICLFDNLSDSEFKKLIRKQYNYINQISKEGFY